MDFINYNIPDIITCILDNVYLYKKRFHGARWFTIRTNRNTMPNTITGSLQIAKSSY
jgi:hypothetical protein